MRSVNSPLPTSRRPRTTTTWRSTRQIGGSWARRVELAHASGCLVVSWLQPQCLVGQRQKLPWRDRGEVRLDLTHHTLIYLTVVRAQVFQQVLRRVALSFPMPHHDDSARWCQSVPDSLIEA